MNFHDARRAAEQLRAIPLEDVLAIIGAKQDPCERAKWHTVQGVLSVTATKFFNWNRAVGGGGAIDLVIHLEELSFKAAIEWLARHFAHSAPFQPADPSIRPPLARHLELPPRNIANLSIVTSYLVHRRRLAPAVIEPLVEAGTIYADDRGNAVFLLLGKKNCPIGAEIRGTTARPWRGMARGSRKDLGYFSTSHPDPNIIVLCESAIDALSCRILTPNSRCISTAGARSNPPWIRPLLFRTQRIYCGFDADPTGDAAARAMIALHPHVRRLRPHLKDWNDTLRAPF